MTQQITIADSEFDYNVPAGFYFFLEGDLDVPGEAKIVATEFTGYELGNDVNHYQWRILDTTRYSNEAECNAALNRVLTERVMEDGFEAEARAALLLLNAGAPLTRNQLRDAILARGL